MMKPILLLYICLITVSPTMHAESNGNPNLETLISEIKRVRADMDIPAVAMIIVDPEQILYSGTFGLADRRSGKSAGSETIFRIGSVTKMFTAMAILLLQEKGILKLDDIAADIVPDCPLKNNWAKNHPVRISHLLEHTSGLSEMSREEFNHTKPMPLEQALNWKADTRQTLWPPGMHSSYTNVGAGLAAYILEKTSGYTYEEYVKKNIFIPLGMKSAGFFPDDYTMTHMATGYDSDGHTVIPYWHMLYRAFGAINIRPVELAPFIHLLLNKGIHKGKRLLTAASIERMETPKTSLAARSGLNYGYGLGNYTTMRKGFIFHGHGGDGDGYLSRLGYNRDTGLGYFVVINAFNDTALNKIRYMIEDYIIGSRHKPEPPAAELTDIMLANYPGHYREITSRFPGKDGDNSKGHHIEIEAIDGKLFIHQNKRRQHLIPLNERHFRYRGQSQATSAFSRGEDGILYFQDENGNYQKREN